MHQGLRSLLFADLIADNAADNSATHRADTTAAGQNRAGHGTGAGAYRGIGVPMGHIAASAKTNQSNGGTAKAQRVSHVILPESSS